MSHQKKIEQVLEYIINEETDAAAKLMHKIMVEKARAIYEAFDDEEEGDFGGFEDESGEEMPSEFGDEAGEEGEFSDDEGFGGDVGDDFASDIGAEGEFDGEFDGEFEGEIADLSAEEVEQHFDTLESMIDDLRASYAKLVGEEAGEEEHEGYDFGELEVEGDDEGQEGDEFGSDEVESDEDEVESEEITESFDETEVTVDMKGEGKYSGTGKNTPKAAVNTKSMYSTAPNKVLPTNGAAPVKAKDGSSGKEAAKTATKQKATTAGAEKARSADMGTEGKFAGTGKNTPKSAVEKTSPLTKPRV